MKNCLKQTLCSSDYGAHHIVWSKLWGCIGSFYHLVVKLFNTALLGLSLKHWHLSHPEASMDFRCIFIYREIVQLIQTYKHTKLMVLWVLYFRLSFGLLVFSCGYFCILGSLYILSTGLYLLVWGAVSYSLLSLLLFLVKNLSLSHLLHPVLIWYAVVSCVLHLTQQDKLPLSLCSWLISDVLVSQVFPFPSR